MERIFSRQTGITAGFSAICPRNFGFYPDFTVYNYKMANVKTMPEGSWLRILSAEKPAAEAIEENAVLEDVFLYYFEDNGAGQTVVFERER